MTPRSSASARTDQTSSAAARGMQKDDYCDGGDPGSCFYCTGPETD